MKRVSLIALALAGLLAVSPALMPGAAAQTTWVEATPPELVPAPSAGVPSRPSLWRRTFRSVVGIWRKDEPAAPDAAAGTVPIGPAMAPTFDTGGAVLTVAPAVPPAEPAIPAAEPIAAVEPPAEPANHVVVARLPRPRPAFAADPAVAEENDTDALAPAQAVLEEADSAAGPALAAAEAPAGEPAADAEGIAEPPATADAPMDIEDAIALSELAAAPASAPPVSAPQQKALLSEEREPDPTPAAPVAAIATEEGSALPQFEEADATAIGWNNDLLGPVPAAPGETGARPIVVILESPYQTGSIGLDSTAGHTPPAHLGLEPAPVSAPTSASTREPGIGDEAVAPHEFVRRLQSLQDQIAQGSTAAFESQRALLDGIEQAFDGMQSEVWQDRQNAAALVTYVLSGGKPTVLRKALAGDPLPALDERLMRGALAYVEGRPSEAKEFFAEIDARDFPASMGSQLAIAQAALVVAEDPKQAAAFLDIARLLSPGTLAEEAALRREILVAGELQDAGKFESLSRQYLQRFRHSVYAGNFRQKFAAALTRMEFIGDHEQLPRLDEILAELEPDARLELFLVIARAAVVQGKPEAARFSAERVLSEVAAGTLDEARATLYRAAASAVMPEGLDRALTDLKAVDRALLEPSDQLLYDAALSTSKLIGAATEVAPLSAAAEIPAEDDGAATTNPIIASAEDAIKAVDALLGGKTR